MQYASSTSSSATFFLSCQFPSPSSNSSSISASFMSSSSSFPLLFLILLVFILLVHPLSYSSSSLLCLPSSVTFLSPPPPNLHLPHSPCLLSFHSCYPFFITFPPLPPYSLLFASSFVPELPIVLTLSSSSS